MEPAVPERLGRLLRILVVTEHGVRAAVHDLPDGSSRDGHVVVVHHHGLDVENRPAGRTRLRLLKVRRQDRGHRRHLGLAVEIPQPQLRQPLPDLP